MTEELAEQAGRALSLSGTTLALAESCTGGLIGHLITGISGASDYFIGGVISYSNQVKQELLAVPQDILIAHGAVSQATAEAMAAGVRRLLRADYGLAVTGIAGPTGGTAQKPVGLTWIALADGELTRAEKHLFDGDRSQVKRQAAAAALQLLLARLKLDE